MAKYLELPVGEALVRRFADQEIFVEIQENVRGEDVFVVQSTSYPANDHLMELLIIIDAMRRASARRITAVLPYFGYARQDRKAGGRTPISAKLVANLITHAGADRVMTLDLHAGQIQGFFDIPTDNLFAIPLFARDIKEHQDLSNLTVVSPDVGGVVRARALAKRLDAQLAIVDKRRERPGESEVMNIIGDVEGRNCILIDDIIDSAARSAMRPQPSSMPVRERFGYITHGVLSAARLHASLHQASSNSSSLIRSSRPRRSARPTISASSQPPISLAKRSLAQLRKNRSPACSTERFRPSIEARLEC
ncbi:ribose-phosphate pyrophosphokinase protein [Fulvimarina pelagi HTCC2506]|uniref:Ribose-phosphate pyrophosphokinase n=2 Tax=Fulvimarina pelagi TaxID=217511 RepID=Q0G092_9HYPH|nr:ribose-phosphate pyrophosphokinase protein [Fulvimarina pelagi HTCC2506]